MALTPEQILEIAGTPAAIPGSYIYSVARAIEAEVRKQDDALILQLVEALEGYRRNQSLDTRRSRIYQRISAVWDQLGPEFKASELYALTGIKNVFGNRILVASVLVYSFGCTIVEDYTPRRRWRKGNK